MSSTNFVVNTAKLHVGQPRKELSNHFNKNSEGVPCFPPVDLDNMTLLQLKVLVNEFFFTLWGMYFAYNYKDILTRIM